MPGYQGVGLVFGALDAGLISGFQEFGLSSDGAHLQRCRPEHGDEEKRKNWSYARQALVAGQELNCISGCCPGLWWKRILQP